MITLFVSGGMGFAQQSGKDSVAVAKRDTSGSIAVVKQDNSRSEAVKKGVIKKIVGLFVKKPIIMQVPAGKQTSKSDSLSLKKGIGQQLPLKDSTQSKNSLSNRLGLSDSSNLLKKVEHSVKSSGNVSYGYDYGVVPFTTSSSLPLGFNKTEGNMKIEALGLPVDVSYYYSDMKAVSGLRNYYRISFDSKKYQENMRNKTSGQLEQEKAKLGSLYQARGVLERKLYYLKSMPEPSALEQGMGNSFDYSGIVKSPALPKDSVKIPGNQNKLLSDSLSKSEKGSTDSLSKSMSKEKHEADSVMAFRKLYEHKYDSVQRVIVKYQKEYDQIQWDIMYAQKMIRQMENADKMLGSQTAPYLGKTNNLLLAVKKLDIGLCYPNNSTFLISGAAIRGVNLEMENNDFYFSFTHGKTMSNLLYTNNLVQNSLSNMQNLYNFFDFNKVNDSRRVTAIKFGPGKKDGTHLHFGILYGFGSTSYVSDQTIIPTGNGYEKNYVIELDGKVVLNKNNALDLVYGKSAVLQSSSLTGDFQKGTSLLSSSLRSNAALARFTSIISKTKTKVTLTTRYVDPFFQSYGVGFMRPDNFRYEIKAEQTITQKIRLTCFFRKEQDNLLSLYNYNTNLTTIGANLNIKLSRWLTIRAGYSPVLQTVTTKDNSYNLSNSNNISTLVATVTPHSKKIKTSFNALYSYYNLSNVAQKTEFQSMSVNNTTMLKSGFRLLSSASWFHSSIVDTSGNNTTLIVEELSYTLRKGATLTIGGKAAHNSVLDWQYGYLLRAMVPVVKHLSLEGSFEKLVIGDFYNSFNRDQVSAFPYYSSIKVIYHW
jgi:hypothetical protein